MASPSATADVVAPRSESSDNYLTHDKGVLSWIFTLDHKRIGVMYLCSVLTAFALGGFFALLVRTELLTPGTRSWIMTPTTRCSRCTARSWCSW